VVCGNVYFKINPVKHIHSYTQTHTHTNNTRTHVGAKSL